MSKLIIRTSLCLTAILAGCAGNGGWTGAVAEKAYDKELDAQRQVAIINNDDYYEYHQDGRIYVLADAKDVQQFLGTGEIPLRVTRVGAGARGETVVFAIAGPEKGKKEGFGAVEIFDGRRVGYEKGFYAEVLVDSRYMVFGDWPAFAAWRSGQPFTAARTMQGPAGTQVLYARADDALVSRFESLHR